MKNTRTKFLIRQMRLALFINLLGLLINLIPDDCKETWNWLKNIPLEPKYIK